MKIRLKIVSMMKLLKIEIKKKVITFNKIQKAQKTKKRMHRRKMIVKAAKIMNKRAIINYLLPLRMKKKMD